MIKRWKNKNELTSPEAMKTLSDEAGRKSHQRCDLEFGNKPSELIPLSLRFGGAGAFGILGMKED